jgi:hypothetical protein
MKTKPLQEPLLEKNSSGSMDNRSILQRIYDFFCCSTEPVESDPESKKSHTRPPSLILPSTQKINTIMESTSSRSIGRQNNITCQTFEEESDLREVAEGIFRFHVIEAVEEGIIEAIEHHEDSHQNHDVPDSHDDDDDDDCSYSP